MPHAARIAEYLLDIGAVKLSVQSPFTWTSGIQSPIYCDNRMIYSHPEARTFVVDCLTSRIKNLHINPDCIAGTATAGIGWGALVADRLKLPFVYVRSAAKGHGAKKQVEGDLRPHLDIVVVEDLLSTAGSAVASVGALRSEGQGRVHDVVAIFSYQLLSGIEAAQRVGIKLHPLADIGTLLKVALEQGRISQEDLREVERFIADPPQWKA